MSYQKVSEMKNINEEKIAIKIKIDMIRRYEFAMGFEEFEFSDNLKDREYQVNKRLRCLKNLKRMQDGADQRRRHYNLDNVKLNKVTFMEKFWNRFKKNHNNKSEKSVTISEVTSDYYI